MKKESLLEKTTGSLATSTGSALIAAVTGTPVAALLPVLTATLANGRHKARVEEALSDLNDKLTAHGEEISKISDAQYKFINESIVTILHSPDDKKIEYLKNGIVNFDSTSRMNLHNAGLISRVLRDITIEEIAFLIKYKDMKIGFHEQSDNGCINFDKRSKDGELATGLIGLGLLTKETAEGLWDDDGAHVFTSLALKVLDVIE